MKARNAGYAAGAKMGAEMGFARGGKVGMPHINARAGIKAPVKVAAVKGNTPKPAAPMGIAAAAMPSPAPQQKLQGFAKGGPIKIKPANKGKLHAKMGVPADKKIPMKSLEKAKSSGSPATKKQAQFAINARGFKHAKGGSVKGKC